MSKILLHTCCAPCATYPHHWLTSNNFEVKAFFYNPNIRPQEEYQRRLVAMERYAALVGLKVIYQANDCRTEPADCQNCYRVRLRKTAQLARELDYDCFSTTLLISPYQKHDQLKRLAETIGLEAEIPFYYQDFRFGFRQGQQLAREMKLYRQKYCGCGADLIAKPLDDTRGKEEKAYAKIG